MAESKSLRIAYGEALAELGAENDKIVVLDADLSNATMTNRFSAVYPDRFFDFGIAEANMACAAAGFAHEGLIPFISTFALFGAGRAYEQIRNSIAYVNANVKFGFSHSGLCVGEDGGSHQSIEDIALMRVMPNMTIFVPCDAVEVRKAVRAAAAIEGPVYIRVARPVCECFTDESTPFVPGKANIMREGGDVAIIAMGLMVAENQLGVSLAGIIADFFTNISNNVTFPVLTFLSAGIINFFVPSGGGQWAVQAPIVMPAATEMGVEYGRAAMAIAWGDQWTNMIQPFWALPALGIAGLKARNIMGYLVIVLIFTGVVACLGFLGWGLFFHG